jgi:phosphatidylserine/phosphatidylglycerophosphate/cardiolipin synthase-like enzyme
MLFAHDREWMQELRFNWSTDERLLFRFDSAHPLSASHHQKLVIVDGKQAFVGGMDLAEGSWDCRDHRCENSDRVDATGRCSEAYHDLHACVTGDVVATLLDVFRSRWRSAGHGELDLPASVPGESPTFPDDAIPIVASRVGTSTTRCAARSNGRPRRLIRRLFIDAIAAAERLVYIENQYFSSEAVVSALVDRMRDGSRPKLQIVIILPREPHSLIEQIVLGNAQATALRTLVDEATIRGHEIGVYYTGGDAPGDPPTYIHSKLLAVDDRFLTVGSANTTNRSMGLDSELNLAWEVRSEEDAELARSIRRVRADLLAEHVGGGADPARLETTEGLVALLDSYARSASHRLWHHSLDPPFEEDSLLAKIAPTDDTLDSEKPPGFERLSVSTDSVFGRGLQLIDEWLRGGA